MNCPNCGHATLPSSTARCGHCNFKLPANIQPQAASSIATLPCWNCRHANAAEAERCECCNAKLQSGTAVPFASRNPADIKQSTRKPTNQ